KVLPDRAHDALSHFGMAKEIGVLEGKEIDYDFDGLVLPKKKSKELEVEIEDTSLCPRYIGMVVKGVEVKESPEWMKEKLRDCGMRPINNIVDATNLIMLELGNPIHAFDFDEIKNQFPISNFQFPNKSKNSNEKNVKIIIRNAKKGEKLILLDGEEKVLDENDLVIANPEKILALAGIKGGLNSGITEKTTDLVIEVANFNAINIRKTRTKLGISTDASARYEKDIDPNLSEKAAVRVLEIIQNIAGGELEGVVDNYPKKINSWKVELSLGYARNLLGVEVSEKQVEKTLGLLGVSFKKSRKGLIYSCEIPTVRIDLKTQEDLIEEIGRIWGYDHIETQPIISAIRPMGLSPANKLIRIIRRELSALGFSEVYNYSFYGEKEKGLFAKREHFEIENPVSPEEKYFRTSLIPGLLKNTALNLGNFSDFGLFEIGKVYEKNEESAKERQLLSGVVARSQEHGEGSFREVKGILQILSQKLDMELDFEVVDSSLALVSSGGQIGNLKMIEKDVQRLMNLKRFSGSLWAFELDLEKVALLRKKARVFEELPRFPKSPRDISFLVLEGSKLSFKDISGILRRNGGKLLESVELFDIFEKAGQKSYAVHLEFMSRERTLENGEVEKEMEKITEALEKEGFEIRK
ncbi:MAG: phenylalanine--tRNA ligase subunit beta, partial [Patescibacteria group bacterium]